VVEFPNRFINLGELILSDPADDHALVRTSFQIWMDADACPIAIREILFRAANRLDLAMTLVANAKMWIPASERFSLILVPSGADQADKKIIELMNVGDLVITADVPLAAEVVKKGGIALGSRGELFDDNSIGERLAPRNVMDEIRASGFETGGPKPLNNKDLQLFANQLDRLLTKLVRNIT